MPRAKITRRDEQGDVVKTFADSAPYEGLKPADIVEVENGHGELRDYFVAEMKWDFSHFGDTLEILIQAVEMRQTIQAIKFGGAEWRDGKWHDTSPLAGWWKI